MDTTQFDNDNDKDNDKCGRKSILREQDDNDARSIFLANHLPFLAASIKRSFSEDYRQRGTSSRSLNSHIYEDIEIYKKKLPKFKNILENIMDIGL